MEIRKAKLLANTRKSGSGGTTFRATLPSTWIRKMGLSEKNRDLKLEFDGEQIIIKNNEEEIKMMNNLLEKAKMEIEKEMEEMGYIDDSDNADRFLDGLARELVEKEILQGNDDIDLYYEKEGEIEELAEDLLEELNSYASDKYSLVKVEHEFGHGYDNWCYVKDYEGLVKWYNEISNDPNEVIYEKIKDQLDTELSKEDFARILDIDIEELN